VEQTAQRVAMEALSVAEIKTKAAEALQSKKPGLAMIRLLALIRAGQAAERDFVLETLLGEMTVHHGLTLPLDPEALRLVTVALARHGVPSGPLKEKLIVALAAGYPVTAQVIEQRTPEPRPKAFDAKEIAYPLNREISQQLLVLGYSVVAPTTTLLTQAIQDQKPEEQIWYARVLCEAPASLFTYGQTLTLFDWLAEAKKLKGGNSFGKFIDVIRQRALAKRSPRQQVELIAAYEQKVAAQQTATIADLPSAPARSFVKNYALDDVPALVTAAEAMSTPDLARGREIFHSTLCARCHQKGKDGQGGVGPDLSGVGGRFSKKDILEAIIDPSKAISEQYQAVTITKKDGSTVSGMISGEAAKPNTVQLFIDPFHSVIETLPADQVLSKEPSKISPMMPGLINSLKAEEIAHLLHYLAK
jgi:putative heme-binding domain-containing protein